MSKVQIIRLESTTIQVQQPADDYDGIEGVVLYFDTATQADRAEIKITLASNPMARAEAIRKRQQEEAIYPLEAS